MKSKCFLNLWSSSVEDLIFQHLDAYEIRTATIVNTTWSEYLSDVSITAWKKVCVHIHPDEGNERFIISNRKYENLYVVRETKLSSEFITMVRNPGRRWKNVTLDHVSFEDISELESFLETISVTIENLDMGIWGNFRSPDNRTSGKVYDFPKLKHLRITLNKREGFEWNSKTEEITKIFGTIPILTHLKLNSLSSENTAGLIMRSDSLKELSMIECRPNFTQETLSKIPSRLEKFYWYTSGYNPDEYSIAPFLKTQSKTLQTFTANILDNLEEIDAIFDMPNLHFLEIYKVGKQRSTLAAYNKVPRILNPPRCGLKKLKVAMLHQSLVEILAICARDITQIYAEDYDLTYVSNPNWFKKLRIFNIDSNIPKFGQLWSMIRAKPNDERSNFEKLICAENLSKIWLYVKINGLGNLNS